MTGYFYKVLRPLVSTFPKMYRCVKTVKVKDGDKDKSNKLMSFYIYDEKISKDKKKKKKNIWTKIEDLKNIELNALPVLMIDKNQNENIW